LWFILRSAFWCRKICTAISEIIFTVFGGYLHCPSNFMEDNHFFLHFLHVFHIIICFPSFSIIYFLFLTHPIIIPFLPLIQVNIDPSPPFLLPLILFTLLLPSVFPIIFISRPICMSYHHSSPLSINDKRQFGLTHTQIMAEGN
jgi:hypothetical protein